MTVEKAPVIAINTPRFCNLGIVSDVWVVSSNTRSKMLNAERFKLTEIQSKRSTPVMTSFDSLFINVGLQRRQADLSVDARKSCTVEKRAWVLRLSEWNVLCWTMTIMSIRANRPNKLAKKVTVEFPSPMIEEIRRWSWHGRWQRSVFDWWVFAPLHVVLLQSNSLNFCRLLSWQPSSL